jgi:cell wall-associated NlpC family hydrolase
MPSIAGAAADNRLTDKPRIHLRKAAQLIENNGVSTIFILSTRARLEVMFRARCQPTPHTAPKGAFWLLAMMLASSAACATPSPKFDAPADPLTTLLVERGESAPPVLASRVRDRASEMVIAAMGFVGVPYRLGGGNVENGFDCSGFTRHVFDLGLGLALPRRADEQAGARSLVSIPRAELRPGDLVFFNTLRRTFSHVGIYIGDGRFIHAPRSGSLVRLEDMRQAYWSRRFTGARRAATAGTPVAVETTLLDATR